MSDSATSNLRRPLPSGSRLIRRRSLLAGFALGALAALAPIGSPRPRLAAALTARGQLLLPRTSGVFVLELETGVEQPLYVGSRPVFAARWSRDRSRVVFSQFDQRAGDRFGGSELYLFEGGQARVVVPRFAADHALAYPSWTADGTSLVYQSSGEFAGGFTVEQAAVDGSWRRTLEEQAASPALSPDGSLLAFVRLLQSDVLSVRPLAGGSVRDVLPPELFIAINAPRFSPDGQRLAFMGVGGPTANRPTPSGDLFASLRPGAAPAAAHGLPWDPWVVNLDGTGLLRVADLAGDHPTLAWSTDGATLAVLGGNGLWLMPADGRSEPQTVSHGTHLASFDWR